MLGTARGSHVRLLQGYCPLCFKGRMGISTSICLARGDPCIDEELQELFGNNGLPMLDLETPGERCEHERMCKAVCVVCARSMADGDGDDFAQLVQTLDRFEEVDSELEGELGTGPLQFLAARMHEDARQTRLKTLHSKFGLTWLDRLGKAVHIECAKETPCGCVVNKGAVRCITHDRRLKPVSVVEVMESAKKEDKVVKSSLVPCDDKEGWVKRAVVMKRATWLDPPTKLASVAPPTSTTAGSQTEGYKKKPRLPVVGKSATPTALKLQEAAKSTAYKINEWTSSRGGVVTVPRPAGVWKGGKYDMDKHHRDYDMWAHGRFLKNGEWFYRRPDGVVVPANEGVAYFDENGQLVPC